MLVMRYYSAPDTCVRETLAPFPDVYGSLISTGICQFMGWLGMLQNEDLSHSPTQPAIRVDIS